MSQNGREEHDEIIRRAQCGDTAAFGELYVLYKRKVYGTCLRVVKNDAEAEDMTQEVFLRVLRKLKSFRGDAVFGTWITRVAINVCLMGLRRQSKKETVSIDELIEADEGAFQWEIAATDHHLMLAAERLTVDRAFARLSPDDRLVLSLCDVEGYDQSEMAIMLGISIPALKARIWRARQQLRFLLGVEPDPLDALSNFNRFLNDQKEVENVSSNE